jgi:hypothetical protein
MIFFQAVFGRHLFWPLIEAKNLRGGLAGQGCREKNLPARADLFFGIYMALTAEEG